MGIIWTIIVGFVVGLLARFFKPGDDSMGIILTVILGIAGAFTAGILGQGMGIYEPNEPAGFIASVIGAMIILFVVGLFKKSRHA